MRDLSPDENLQEGTAGARAPPTVVEGQCPCATTIGPISA